MKFTRKNPTPVLNDLVKCYWKLELEEQDVPYSQLYFPYGSFELIYFPTNKCEMNFVGDNFKFEQPELFYSGQITKPFQLHFKKSCICYGVSLYPWAGKVLYTIPANEFKNRLIPLHDIESENLKFEKENSDDQVFSKFESYLMARASQNTMDEMSKVLAKKIINLNDTPTIKSLTSEIGLSKRRIEQRFLHSTGLSISTFIRKIRFQKAVEYLKNKSESNSLTEIGLSAGYYDQSHFISEFKSFSALTPTDFLKQTSELKTVIVSLSKNEY